METWELKRLHLIPIFLVFWLLSGLLICFLIALSNGHVSAYVPFISEAGGKLPESGIFGIFLCFGAVLGFVTMLIRYLVISKCNLQCSQKIDVLNKISLLVGFISLCGMIVVGVYSMYGILSAHLVGARMLFYCSILYGFLQMLISFFIYPKCCRIAIFRIRLLICNAALLFLIGMMIMFPIGLSQWNAKYPAANKVPGDQGFTLILASSVCEWLMAVSFLCFFLSFVKEFRNFTINISIFQNDQRDRNLETTRLIS